MTGMDPTVYKSFLYGDELETFFIEITESDYDLQESHGLVFHYDLTEACVVLLDKICNLLQGSLECVAFTSVDTMSDAVATSLAALIEQDNFLSDRVFFADNARNDDDDDDDQDNDVTLHREANTMKLVRASFRSKHIKYLEIIKSYVDIRMLRSMLFHKVNKNSIVDLSIRYCSTRASLPFDEGVYQGVRGKLSLRSLSLLGNGYELSSALLKLFKTTNASSMSQIETLRLQAAPIGFSVDASRALKKFLTQTQNLQLFSIHGKHPAQIADIMQGLRSNRSLTTLQMHDCGLSADQLQDVLHCTRNNHNLTAVTFKESTEDEDDSLVDPNQESEAIVLHIRRVIAQRLSFYARLECTEETSFVKATLPDNRGLWVPLMVKLAASRSGRSFVYNYLHGNCKEFHPNAIY